jgi:hypothetical protein
VITTVTTVTATMIGLSIMPGIIVTIALIAFLCIRELASTNNGSSQRLLKNSLDVSIIPLVITFAVIFTTNVIEILL